uniref:Uncharacterized protein n=1 Tax=Aegilops tauschii subsp. strangulata TaxID=200361 RepID=A0A453RRX3_AEGTS
LLSSLVQLLAVKDLWEQGLCASNFDGFWISKTWNRGIGNLSVEDFLDRSQNFARSVGKVEMQNICECLKDTVSKLTDFFRGKIDALTLKILIFGALNQDVPVSHPSPKHVKSKRKRELRHDPGNSEKQQKKVKHTAQRGRAANRTDSILPTPTVFMPHVHQILGFNCSSKPGICLFLCQSTSQRLIGRFTPMVSTGHMRSCMMTIAGYLTESIRITGGYDRCSSLRGAV